MLALLLKDGNSGERHVRITQEALKNPEAVFAQI